MCLSREPSILKTHSKQTRRLADERVSRPSLISIRIMNSHSECLERPYLNERLRHLAMTAQRHPKGSIERQRILTELVDTMLRSRKLCRPRRGQFRLFYDDIYAEALQRLFLFICERIDDYDSKRGEVLQWANFLLSRRFFIEASKDYLPTTYKGIDAKSIKRLTLEQIDHSNPIELNPQLAPSLSQEVMAYIEEDPEDLFKKTCVVDHPAANFRHIALRRLEGYSWKDLSSELDVAIPTLSSFYRRAIARFAQKIKDYL